MPCARSLKPSAFRVFSTWISRSTRVYLAAAEALNLEPGQCMMVAAHSDDLKAAGAAGLRTGHTARPDEFGPGKGEPGPTVPVDIFASSLAALADKFGL